jgi:proteic killer suppression protein
LKAFVARGQTKGLPAAYVEKIRDIMIFLLDMEEIDEVFDLKKYKPHRLTGDRAGTFSLSVTPNWRITFGCDAGANERIDVDYEDYH